MDVFQNTYAGNRPGIKAQDDILIIIARLTGFYIKMTSQNNWSSPPYV